MNNSPYIPYDPADIILTQIDIESILDVLSEQDRSILLWFLRDGHTLPEIAEKLKKHYGASKTLTGRLVGAKAKQIINKLRALVGKDNLKFRERIKHNRTGKVKKLKKRVKRYLNIEKRTKNKPKQAKKSKKKQKLGK